MVEKDGEHLCCIILLYEGETSDFRYLSTGRGGPFLVKHHTAKVGMGTNTKDVGKFHEGIQRQVFPSFGSGKERRQVYLASLGDSDRS